MWFLTRVLAGTHMSQNFNYFNPVIGPHQIAGLTYLVTLVMTPMAAAYVLVMLGDSECIRHVISHQKCPFLSCPWKIFKRKWQFTMSYCHIYPFLKHILSKKINMNIVCMLQSNTSCVHDIQNRLLFGPASSPLSLRGCDIASSCIGWQCQCVAFSLWLQKLIQKISYYTC